MRYQDLGITATTNSLLQNTFFINHTYFLCCDVDFESERHH